MNLGFILPIRFPLLITLATRVQFYYERLIEKSLKMNIVKPFVLIWFKILIYFRLMCTEIDNKITLENLKILLLFVSLILERIHLARYFMLFVN
jgi:hypothetical protein